jgi:hypothetical protein
MTDPCFHADPTVLVYAVRHVLHHPGAHAAIAVTHAIRGNVGQLTASSRSAIVRDVTGWLDGPGSNAAPTDRAPWVQCLTALGVRRDAEPMPLPDVLEQPARRHTDRRRTA